METVELYPEGGGGEDVAPASVPGGIHHQRDIIVVRPGISSAQARPDSRGFGVGHLKKRVKSLVVGEEAGPQGAHRLHVRGGLKRAGIGQFEGLGPDGFFVAGVHGDPGLMQKRQILGSGSIQKGEHRGNGSRLGEKMHWPLPICPAFGV
jgi:hypothetical protein